MFSALILLSVAWNVLISFHEIGRFRFLWSKLVWFQFLPSCRINDVLVSTFVLYHTAVDAVPSFTEEPPNPSRVDEGDNITLRWTYSIDGTFRDSRFLSPTGQTIALKDGGGFTVNPKFSDRVQVSISDSEATLTLLHVNRSDDGGYQYIIQNTNFLSASSSVNVFVRCK